MAPSLFKIRDMNDHAIADEAYSRFDPGGALGHDRVNDCLAAANSKFETRIETNHERERLFVTAVLEIIGECLPNLENAPKLQKTVALHMAQELIRGISDVSGRITLQVDGKNPPVYGKVLRQNRSKYPGLTCFSGVAAMIAAP